MQKQKEKRERAGLRRLLVLALSFLKIGLFTFGGGYAMIALIQKEFVAKKKWVGEEEFLDMVAIAESTPGPLAINSATYIGYKAGGVWGAAVSTLCVCIPAFLIIYLISLFFDAFLQLTLVNYAFKGIQVAVVFLILNAGWKMLKQMKKNAFNLILFCGVFGCLVGFSVFAVDFSTLFYILICGACGLAVYLTVLVAKRRKARSEPTMQGNAALSEKTKDVPEKTEQNGSVGEETDASRQGELQKGERAPEREEESK